MRLLSSFVKSSSSSATLALVLILTASGLAGAEQDATNQIVIPLLAFDNFDRIEVFEAKMHNQKLSVSADGWDICIISPYGKCWHAKRYKGSGNIHKGVLLTFACVNSTGYLQPIFPWGRYRALTKNSNVGDDRNDELYISQKHLKEIPDQKFNLQQSIETAKNKRFGSLWALKIDTHNIKRNHDLFISPRPTWQAHYANLYLWLPNPPISSTEFVTSHANAGMRAWPKHINAPISTKLSVPAYKHMVKPTSGIMVFPYIPKHPVAIGDAITVFVENQTFNWIHTCTSSSNNFSPFLSVVIHSTKKAHAPHQNVIELRLGGVDHFTIKHDRLKFSLAISGSELLTGEFDAGAVKYLKWPELIPIDNAIIEAAGTVIDSAGVESDLKKSDYSVRMLSDPTDRRYYYAFRSNECGIDWDSGLDGFKLSLPKWIIGSRWSVHKHCKIICGTFKP